jgi:hypothetical protein
MALFLFCFVLNTFRTILSAPWIFLAIQEAFHIAGEPDKALLFFKLHELQTCSWGVSKVGRVAQIINATQDEMISEFDTSIFSLINGSRVIFGNLHGSVLLS